MEGPSGDAHLEERVPDPPEPSRRRVKSRAKALKHEQIAQPVEDSDTQAHAVLKDSDARTEDPAARDLEDGRVERRTSEEATPPPDP